ncbi:MAG: 3-deoxy-D-manno-octulosonic acid kinase [Luteimonas sp.]
MVAFDATESLTPYREAGGEGAILFDASQLRQVDPRWFDPAAWGERARPVRGSGRGGAWFIEASHGPCVLREYRRGGWAARFSEDRHLWRGFNRVRSFAEFRLLRELLRKNLPVPHPVAACYARHGLTYRASILLQRIVDVRTLADLASLAPQQAPWEAAGRLVARFHRAGLDHADLNANNLLFGDDGPGWVIDLDRSVLRIPETAWREANLARLKRSLLKLRGPRREDAIETDFKRLRAAYDDAWAKGY